MFEGEDGHRGWLWVMPSASLACWILAPIRRTAVSKGHFVGLVEGIGKNFVVCDRHCSYKSLAGQNPRIVPAFCRAHVRRNLIDCARSEPAATEHPEPGGTSQSPL